MSGAAATLLNSLKATQLKGLPGWVLKNASMRNVKAVTGEWTQNYAAKYFKTGSHKPVVHVMVALCALGYYMEYPHLAASERMRKHH
eukprot:m.55531 g.55531  ORF g.55531 m.55531 type:complete len:87 (+) comp11494_c0_seq1:273-533(+)